MEQIRAYLSNTLTRVLGHNTPDFITEESLFSQLYYHSLELYNAYMNPDDAMASWLGICKFSNHQPSAKCYVLYYSN